MPKSSRCETILSQPLTPNACPRSREARRWVFCRAWDLHNRGEASFRESIRLSWREFHAQCWGQEGQ